MGFLPCDASASEEVFQKHPSRHAQSKQCWGVRKRRVIFFFLRLVVRIVLLHGQAVHQSSPAPLWTIGSSQGPIADRKLLIKTAFGVGDS